MFVLIGTIIPLNFMYYILVYLSMGFPGSPVVKNLPAIAGNLDSIPGPKRSPREGNSNPLQYSFLGNPIDSGAWRATVHGVTKELDTTQRLEDRTFVLPPLLLLLNLLLDGLPIFGYYLSILLTVSFTLCLSISTPE